jgi:hypothetical protein
MFIFRNAVHFLSIIVLVSFSHTSNANFRRSDTFDYTPSYFIYPIASKIPGLGEAAGGGATINNIGGTDLDFTGVHLDGDFQASVFSFLNFHVWKEVLVIDAGVYNFDVASTTYERGSESDPDDIILPHVEGEGHFYQVTFMGMQRMFELFVRTRVDQSRVNSVLDKDGNEFKSIDRSKKQSSTTSIGLTLDITDHRYDPREGLRLELLRKRPSSASDDLSDFYVDDINISAFIPIGEQSTWAFNYFQSNAHITNQATTNVAELKKTLGLNCDSIPNTSAKANCMALEEKRISQRIDYNKYGRSTPLGGSQRLRSFDNGRFSAGHTKFIGTEFRLNFRGEQEPFDILFMKGVRTGFQLAVFSAIGAVGDRQTELNYTLNSSGVGARVIFKGGTVFRADWAQGSEGSKATFFVDYPWGLNPLDNSSN